MRHEPIHKLAVLDENFTRRDVAFDDPKVTNLQIVTACGLAPADEYMVFQWLASGELEDIRPSEIVDVAAAGIEQVFVIRAAKTYSFIVNGLSLRWPRKTLKAKNVLRLVRAPEEHELVQERSEHPDHVFGDEDDVRLDGDGLERFVTRPRVITIYINGTAKSVTAKRLSYEDLVRLAFENPPTGPEVQFTITYSNGPEGQTSGAVTPGNSVKIKNGMEFDVTPTNRS